MRLFLLPIVLTSALLVACSSDDGGAEGGSGNTVATGCAGDTRKDVYTAGLAKPAGTLSVKLLEARTANGKPGTPIKGTNALTLEVVDAGGQPLEGATVTVTPWMPDHAHGSAVKPEVKVMGGGKYDVEKVYLSMAGLWQLKVAVQAPNGGPLQEATFQFCVDG